MQAPSSRSKSEATFSFELGPEFQNLYNQVCAAMNTIQHSHGTPAKAKELTKIVDQW